MIESYREIELPYLPDALFTGISPLMKPAQGFKKSIDPSFESQSGRELLRKMITDKYNSGVPVFTTLKYEKPSATLNGDVVSISFSHTSEAVSAVISKKWVVGIDMESAGRVVNERLAKRMKHSGETLKFYKYNPIIKIWTMKEAALKAIGTGLRKPMNSICLETVTENYCRVKFFNGINAEICSFKLNDQWISICYISSKLTEHFLPKAYVPIQTGRNQTPPHSSG